MKKVLQYIDVSGIDSQHFQNHIYDCKRMQRILRAHNWEASLEECYTLWDEHSNRSAAGWLVLPDDDDEVFSIINPEEDEWYTWYNDGFSDEF